MDSYKRKACNYILNNVISLYLSLNPDLRYIQGLWNLDIIDKNDRFYEEPYETIVRILPEIKKIIDIEPTVIRDKIKRRNIITSLEELKLL